MTMETKSMNRAGLTTKELLVSIAVILVIAAIMVPVLSKSKQAAKATVCMSNMRQLIAVYMVYHSDHDEWSPYQPDAVEMKQYTAGFVLECFAFKAKHPEASKKSSPYVNTLGVFVFSDERRKLRDQCVATRGSDLPLILDKNHMGELSRAMYGDEWMLVGRRNGSVTRVPPLSVEVRNNVAVVTGSPPCDPTLIDLNY